MRFKFENLIGQKRGKLTIVEYIGIATKGHLWKFRCDCGNHGAITSSAFNSEKQNGCFACGKLKKLPEILFDPLYKIWLSIKQRCYNPNEKAYVNYGGRGVTMCEEWLQDFNSFKDWCLNNGWEQGVFIDKDKKGSLVYGPDTCSIVTRTENNRMRRGLKLNMEIANEIRNSNEPPAELASKYGVHVSIIYGVKRNEIWNPDKS